MSALAPILQAYFTDKLIRQRRAGPNTLSAYRDTWRLLLQFASHTTATAPSGLDLAQIDAGLVTAFLTYLETERANTAAEIDALLAAPDLATRLGRRDHALLLLACKTGLWVSELIALTRSDIHLDHHGAHVRCDGLSRVRDKPCYAERWFMPSYPASGVDLPCGRGGSRLLSPELLGIIKGRRGRRAACRVPGSGMCWCPAVPCAR